VVVVDVVVDFSSMCVLPLFDQEIKEKTIFCFCTRMCVCVLSLIPDKK